MGGVSPRRPEDGFGEANTATADRQEDLKLSEPGSKASADVRGNLSSAFRRVLFRSAAGGWGERQLRRGSVYRIFRSVASFRFGIVRRLGELTRTFDRACYALCVA